MTDKKIENVAVEQEELNIDEISAEELEAQAGGMMESISPDFDCNGSFTCGTYD
jgi:hypothetical protein